MSGSVRRLTAAGVWILVFGPPIRSPVASPHV